MTTHFHQNDHAEDNNPVLAYLKSGKFGPAKEPSDRTEINSQKPVEISASDLVDEYIRSSDFGPSQSSSN